MKQPQPSVANAPSGAARPLRTGAQYLASLNDGRQVFIEGERVTDVSRHPAFREAARSVAQACMELAA